jgi:hypothetical protein
MKDWPPPARSVVARDCAKEAYAANAKEKLSLALCQTILPHRLAQKARSGQLAFGKRSNLSEKLTQASTNDVRVQFNGVRD